MYDPQPNYATHPKFAAPAHLVPNRKQVDWRLTGAYVIAALAIGVACACLWLLQSYKAAVSGQMAQMHHAVATAQKAQSNDARTIEDLSGRLNGDEGQLSALAPFSTTCSTDLEGPNGPARYFFACSPRQPGSGS